MTTTIGNLGLDVYRAGVFQLTVLEVFEAAIEEAVNEVTRWSAQVPAVYTASVDLGDVVAIIREDEGEVFHGYVLSRTVNVSEGGEQVLTLTGMSLAVELVWGNTYYGMNLIGTTGVAMDILLDDSGWTHDTEGGLMGSNFRADGMTLWAAAVQIATIAGGYLRDPGDDSRELVLTSLNPDSGILVRNVELVDPAIEHGIITRLGGYNEDSANVVNRIVPFGASDEDAILDLSRSDRSSPYTIQTLIPTAPSIVDYYYSDGTPASMSLRSVGRNRLFLGVWLWPNATDEVNEITVGATDGPGFTRLVRNTTGTRAVEVWYFRMPPKGDRGAADHEEGTVKFYPNYITSVALPASIIFSLQDVFQETPIRTAAGSVAANGTSTTPGHTIASAIKDLVVTGTTWASGTGTAAAGITVYPPTVVTAGILDRSSMGTMPGAASVNPTWTLSGSVAWKAFALSLQPALNYYIEDAASVAAYGLRVGILQAKDIHLAGDMVADSNALYDYAVTMLERAKDPLIDYGDLGAVNLPAPATWAIGNTLAVQYRGVDADTGAWLDIDADAILTGRTQRYDGQGLRHYGLRLASSLRRPSAGAAGDQLQLLTSLAEADAISRLPAL